MSDHFAHLMLIDKSRVTTPEDVIDPDHHEEVKLRLCRGSREDYV